MESVDVRFLLMKEGLKVEEAKEIEELRRRLKELESDYVACQSKIEDIAKEHEQERAELECHFITQREEIKEHFRTEIDKTERLKDQMLHRQRYNEGLMYLLQQKEEQEQALREKFDEALHEKAAYKEKAVYLRRLNKKLLINKRVFGKEYAFENANKRYAPESKEKLHGMASSKTSLESLDSLPPITAPNKSTSFYIPNSPPSTPLRQHVPTPPKSSKPKNRYTRRRHVAAKTEDNGEIDSLQLPPIGRQSSVLLPRRRKRSQ